MAQPPPALSDAVVPRLRTVHTSELAYAELDAVREMVASTFVTEEFGAEDWEHALGGMHVLVEAGPDVVGHAAVVQRRVLHRGKALRTGYVEGVGVHRDWQRRGIGGRLMGEIERIISAAYELGALGATDEGAQLYRSRGWRPWTGTTSVLAPEGKRSTPQDSPYVYVFEIEGQPLDWQGELACDWRAGDVW